jgi:hypothetical protein
MENLKNLETNFSDTMATQLSEMREMIAQLMQASKALTPPPPEGPASLNKQNMRDKNEDTDKDKKKRLFLLIRPTRRMGFMRCLGTLPTHWPDTRI